MLFSSSSIIDREWHDALQRFSGYENVVEYYIFAEESDGDGYDDRQVSLSLAEIAKVRHAFRQLSNITGTSFLETNDFENATLNVYSVSEYDEEDTHGETVMEDGWFDITWKNFGGSSMTDYEILTLYHEIGHAAGLDHPNGNGDEPGWDDSITVMSYNEGEFIPTTFRELDIEALQDLFTTDPVESMITDFYHGDDSNNNLRGTDRHDEIIGFEGNDILKGIRGGDIILGMQGDDEVRGGNGRDVLSGGDGSDTIFGGFGLNTYKDEKDGEVDSLYFKSDQLAYNWIYDKAENNPTGLKTDEIKKLDDFDQIFVQGVETHQLSFASVSHTNGLGSLDGIGIYASGFLEAVYTGGDLTVLQLQNMTVGVSVDV
ncbi:MAG: Serralysin C [Synechococcus sp. CC9902]|nr:MAG: Serralysin C [Synechococcus sp. CC9902]